MTDVAISVQAESERKGEPRDGYAPIFWQESTPQSDSEICTGEPKRGMLESKEAWQTLGDKKD